MIKGITRLEHKIGERVYHFLCDQDAPVGEVHDALCMFKAKVMEILNNAHEAEVAAKRAQEEKIEE